MFYWGCFVFVFLSFAPISPVRLFLWYADDFVLPYGGPISRDTSTTTGATASISTAPAIVKSSRPVAGGKSPASLNTSSVTTSSASRGRRGGGRGGSGGGRGGGRGNGGKAAAATTTATGDEEEDEADEDVGMYQGV